MPPGRWARLAHAPRLGLSYPELCYWLDHGGSLEYRRCCEVWALEAAAEVARTPPPTPLRPGWQRAQLRAEEA